MLTTVAVLFLSGTLGEPPSKGEAIAFERRQAIIDQCHIEADRLVVEHWDNPSSYVIVIKRDDPLPDAKPGCIGEALAPANVNFSFEDYDVGEAYSLREARSALGHLGLFNLLPVFASNKESLASFAAKLETLCGARPRSVLKVVDDDIELAAGALRSTSVKRFGQIGCAVSAATAAGHDPFAPRLVPVPSVPYPSSLSR